MLGYSASVLDDTDSSNIPYAVTVTFLDHRLASWEGGGAPFLQERGGNVWSHGPEEDLSGSREAEVVGIFRQK